jgi:hypothetical protein
MPTDFSVYHFKTRTEAYQWYLSQPDVLNDVDVTISSDNCVLNDMAIANGKAYCSFQITEQQSSVTAVVQVGHVIVRTSSERL